MPGPARTRLAAKGRRKFGRATFAGALIAAVLFSCLAAASAGAAANEAEFYGRTGAGNSVSCAIYDGYAGSTAAFCEYVSNRTQAKATLTASGAVVLCRTHSITSNRCGLGNAGENSPTYKVGKTVTIGPFACTVRGAGVRCIVTASGKGFLLGAKRLQGVGGATVRRR
ncbi:MAG: hypothetical protein JWO14_1666 [Solirubrobacterales bacterium]|nr:hypothetical protein [Solirubrobacterales bacterium]